MPHAARWLGPLTHQLIAMPLVERDGAGIVREQDERKAGWINVCVQRVEELPAESTALRGWVNRDRLQPPVRLGHGAQEFPFAVVEDRERLHVSALAGDRTQYR